MKNMSKIIGLSVAAGLLLSGCGQAAGSGEAHTVYRITMDLADNYWQSIDKGCKQAADAILIADGTAYAAESGAYGI